LHQADRKIADAEHFDMLAQAEVPSAEARQTSVDKSDIALPLE
jgi:hypothetical protein